MLSEERIKEVASSMLIAVYANRGKDLTIAINSLNAISTETVQEIFRMIEGMTSDDVFYDTDLCPYTINVIAEKIKAKMQE